MPPHLAFTMDAGHGTLVLSSAAITLACMMEPSLQSHGCPFVKYLLSYFFLSPSGISDFRQNLLSFVKTLF